MKFERQVTESHLIILKCYVAKDRFHRQQGNHRYSDGGKGNFSLTHRDLPRITQQKIKEDKRQE